MKVFYSRKLLEYSSPGHPESPSRIWNIYEALKDDTRYTFTEPHTATINDLLLVHDQSFIDSVRNNTFLDVDTPNIPKITEYALLSVGSAIDAAYAALEERHAFSLARPPGHHATRSSVGGFCYFNNIAIAVAHTLSRVKKVAILDIDVHHGNGTQDIFLGNKNVLYCSLHQTPLYPGTGLESEKNCYNYPLPPGIGGAQYIDILMKALMTVRQYAPHVLAVSVGFDTYKEDTLGGFQLDFEDYRTIGRKIQELGLPAFFVLEGGYSADIGRCAASFFDGVHTK